jgi:TM2 domain-containing membrane protein YozV
MSSVTKHISDVDTWGHPDRNYYIFLALTLFTGFFGFDHFYLRSFGTGTQKLLINVVFLGFWYIWDIIQVIKDGKKVRTEGLASPLDWVQGIGRGVFRKSGEEGAAQAEKYAAPKSYLLYAILAIVFGWFGADKFYLGYTWQGLAKLFSVFNIFLFLFGILWVAWDGIQAFFMTDSLLKDGIKAPFPYTFFFKKPILVEELFKVKEVTKEPEPVESESGGFLSSLPNPVSVLTAVAPVTFGPATAILANAGKTVGALGQVVTAAASTAATLPGMLEQVTTGLTKSAEAAIASSIPTIPTMPSYDPKLSSIQSLAASRTPLTQHGGGRNNDSANSGVGPVLAGSLTALVLAGGLKGFYDFVSKQYG